MYQGLEIADKMDEIEKIGYKRKLVEECIANLRTAAGNTKIAMDEAQSSANEYGRPKDRYDSYRMQVLKKRDMFAKQLIQTNEQIDVLGKIGVNKLHDKVEFGSVVLTNKQNMFIATGIGRLKFEDGDIFVISPNVPVYEAIKGKRKGDVVDFRGSKFKIGDVF